MVVDYVSATDNFFSIPVWVMAWNVILRQGKKLHRVPQLCCLVLKGRGVLCYMVFAKFHWAPVNGKQWCWWVCFLVFLFFSWFVVGVLSSPSSSNSGQGCRQ